MYLGLEEYIQIIQYIDIILLCERDEWAHRKVTSECNNSHLRRNSVPPNGVVICRNSMDKPDSGRLSTSEVRTKCHAESAWFSYGKVVRQLHLHQHEYADSRIQSNELFLLLTCREIGGVATDLTH
jgi:hypothetical protein